MADRTPVETLAAAITLLRCEHRHPITQAEPGAPGRHGPCEHCHQSAATTWRVGGLVGEELRGPLAVWLDDHLDDHSTYRCLYDYDDTSCPAVRTARVILGAT
jgi:hypothetical protein